MVAITGSLDLTYVEKAFSAGAEIVLPEHFGAESLVRVLRLAAGATRPEAPMRPRHDPRFPVEFPVRCRLRGDAETTREIAGQTGNVSLGGLLLLLRETLGRGSVLSLKLELLQGPMAADGAVIWQDSRPVSDGKTVHGVRLLRFPEDGALDQHRRFLSGVAADQRASLIENKQEQTAACDESVKP